MLLFPPSSIREPLQDSTNHNRLGGPQGDRARHCSNIEVARLDSSDTSIYDASKASSCASDLQSVTDPDYLSDHSSSLSNHDSRLCQRRVKSEGSGQHDMVRFVNRPNGTPLFTIAEQKSRATLRSQVSRATFRGRRLAHIVDTGSGRLKAASADDTVLLEVRDNQTKHKDESSLGSQNATGDPMHPLEPLFSPPFRKRTPEGTSHWSSERQVSFVRQIARTLSHAMTSFPAMRPRLLAMTLREQIRSRRNDQRPWHPPVSGHSTFGYETASEHPWYRTVMDEAPLVPIPEPSVAERESLDRRCRSVSDNTTPAQRALGAITGSAISFNPARTVKNRSVSLPQRRKGQDAGPNLRVTSHEIPQQSQQPESYPSDTMRTSELIDIFPSPPSISNLVSLADAGERARLFSPRTPSNFPNSDSNFVADTMALQDEGCQDTVGSELDVSDGRPGHVARNDGLAADHSEPAPNLVNRHLAEDMELTYNSAAARRETDLFTVRTGETRTRDRHERLRAQR